MTDWRRDNRTYSNQRGPGIVNGNQQSLDYDNGYKQGFRDGLHHQGCDLDAEALADRLRTLRRAAQAAVDYYVESFGLVDEGHPIMRLRAAVAVVDGGPRHESPEVS